jgi:C-terminal processing protease CtpA/Prc
MATLTRRRLLRRIASITKRESVAGELCIAAEALSELDDEEFIAAVAAAVRAHHGHSYLRANGGYHAAVNPPASQRPPDFFWDARRRVGRVKLYTYLMRRGEHWDPRPAHTVARCRRQLDAWLEAGMRGLVVDLSAHSGGSYRPALHAIGAHLLRGCELFSMVGADGGCQRVSYDGDAERHGRCRRSGRIALLSGAPGMRVAVVVSERTASSGEIAASMLVGKAGVRTFGRAPTAGALSINEGFALGRHGAGDLELLLLLTVRRVRTTDGVCHDDERLVPDVLTRRPVTEAARWAASRPTSWPS